MRLDPRSLATLHAVVAVVPLVLWTLFHVWEQWASLRGREAWLARMEQTSSGLVIVLEVVAIIVPITLCALLVIRALVRLCPARRPRTIAAGCGWWGASVRSARCSRSSS